MADSCIGPNGEDICHLAKGPPTVDCTTIPRLRADRVDKSETRDKKRTRDTAKHTFTPGTILRGTDKPVRKSSLTVVANSVGGDFAPEGNPALQIAKRAVDAVFSKPSEEEKEERETDRDQFRMPRTQLRPNTQALTSEEMNKARMANVAKTAYKQGFGAAQAEIDGGSLRGWTIDTELSNN